MKVDIDPVLLLQSLIRFPSVSSTSNVEITQAVAALLIELGFTVSFCDYRDVAGVAKSNLISTRPPLAGTTIRAPGLAYFCHTDVVPAKHWNGPGEAFQSVVHDERIYGRGSCDMKGSLVAMLAAVSSIDQSAQTAPIHIICTADEEVAFCGAKQLVAKSPEYRGLVDSQPLAIIGEPTGCRVVHAHKGILGFSVVSRGRAAHSSTRHGLNANIAMVPMLVELLRLQQLSETDPTLQDSRFNPPTLSWNFGVSDFTEAVNVVPERSEAWVLLRPMPGITGEGLVAAAHAKAIELGLEFRLHEGGNPVWVAPDAPWIQTMCGISGCEAPATVCYGTDGGEFSELEKLVICGPGEILQAHTNNEFLSLAQLRCGIEMYTKALQRWCTNSTNYFTETV